jgi:acetyl-CoA synthetase
MPQIADDNHFSQARDLAGGPDSMLESSSGLARAQVARQLPPIAKPREIHVVPGLPKTRSGKIMRRLLRDVAEGRELGDTSTLVDPGVFEAIQASKAPG